MTSKAATGAERVAKHRAARKAAGHIRRDYYATEAEHRRIRAVLDDIRGRK